MKIGGYGAAAYAQTAQRLREAASGASTGAGGIDKAASSFGAMLGNEVNGAVQGLRNGEKQSIDGLLGRAGLQGVVEAVSAAETRPGRAPSLFRISIGCPITRRSATPIWSPTRSSWRSSSRRKVLARTIPT